MRETTWYNTAKLTQPRPYNDSAVVWRHGTWKKKKKGKKKKGKKKRREEYYHCVERCKQICTNWFHPTSLQRVVFQRQSRGAVLNVEPFSKSSIAATVLGHRKVALKFGAKQFAVGNWTNMLLTQLQLRHWIHEFFLCVLYQVDFHQLMLSPAYATASLKTDPFFSAAGHDL